MKNKLFFFIGTEAELIKVFPVIIEAQKNRLECHIIASGQNDIDKSSIFKMTDCVQVELKLSEEKSIQKSSIGLLRWWIQTYKQGKKKIAVYYANSDLNQAFMIVHGDTVSTYMGAKIGKKLGMKVCHIEAGLRSHKLFNPFPEEIDRLLTSRIARVHFSPGDEAANNLRNTKGVIVNTKQNTLLDSLNLSRAFPATESVQNLIQNGLPYFVFVMHRQENLVQKEFVCSVMEEIQNLAQKIRAIIVVHTITGKAFKKYGIYDRLNTDPHINMIPRMEYFDFMKLLDHAEFVITDGGSNQEELYYMGKPALILRKTTERSEGIGKNARLYRNIEDIKQFGDQYKYLNIKEKIISSPTHVIIDYFNHSHS